MGFILPSRWGRWQTFLLLNLFQQIRKYKLCAKFNASDELVILHEQQLKTPNASDGNASMSLITNKLESSLDLHDLEKFIDKKYRETRQRDGINRCDSSSVSASEEVQSSLNRSTKYGTFENSPSSAFYMDKQSDKDICCGNYREGLRGKSNEVLEKGFIKYRIDRIEFLREEIKAKNKIIGRLFTLKLSLRDEHIFSYKNVQINKSSNNVDNETVFYNCSPHGPGFKENSNDLNENIINIFDELNTSFTLNDDFKQPCHKAFIDNSESIIDFNIDLQFNSLKCETNDSIKQIGSKNNSYI